MKTYGNGKAVKLSARHSPQTKINKNSFFVNRNGTRTLSRKVFRKLRWRQRTMNVLHLLLHLIFLFISLNIPSRKFSKKSVDEMMKGSRLSNLYLGDVKVFIMMHGVGKTWPVPRVRDLQTYLGKVWSDYSLGVYADQMSRGNLKFEKYRNNQIWK